MEPSPYVYRSNTSPFIAHNMLKYIVPHNNLMKGPRRQRPVTPQPRPRPCYKFYMFFLIHTTTGQNQIIMYTDPISVHLLPITSWHGKIYSSTQLCNEMTDPTENSSNPTKTQTVLQSLYVVSKTHYYRTESSSYVYWPNISPFLTITY